MPERVHSRDGLGGTFASDNLDSQSLKVLLVGCRDELCQLHVVFGAVKRLAPHDVRSCRMCLKLDGEQEVMTVEVLELEQLVRNDAHKPAFVRVVLSVGPMHG